MKKYGLLTYDTPAPNLGDEIQSLAAKQFLPRVDYYIDRDRMSSFKEKEIVHVIMNGWFKYNSGDWPPPANINPLFISFSITSFQNAHLNLANAKWKSYYEKYEPIGCRDYYTLELLKNIGVKTYFSGCLTLTFRNKSRERNNKIYFVDPFANSWRYNFPKPGDETFPDDIWKKFPRHIRNNGIFLTHAITEKDPDLRLQKAQQLIDTYSEAKLVVTSRLHCALPCLALGTPVVFIYDKDILGSRSGGLLDFIKHYSLEGMRNNNFDINWDNPESKLADFSDIADNLRKKCREFVENA
jgi:hypothetical protein